MSRRPVVVIAGRPNVGKSSIMNRIVGRRIAVVEEHPGVTRDRKSVEAEWTGVAFDLVDTGGWMASGDALDDKVSEQAERALAEADLILCVVDASVGATDDDLSVARIVKRTGRPAILVANKVDDPRHEAAIWELMSLGLGEPMPLSALHGRGTGDLLDAVVAALPEPGEDELVGDEDEEDPTTRVAIVGRPNVGKSTLFNRMIGEERSVIHDMPGTTRDAIDTVVETEDGPIRFIDTAGMRRRARTERGAESHSVIRALDALDRADIALLVVDATVGASHQDQRLAERISTAGCPAVVLLNKWDLIATEDREDVLAGVGERLAFLGTAPVLKISASSGRGVHRILPAIFDAVDTYSQRVSTGSLNRAMRDLQAAHPAPGVRIRYAVQGAIEPPTFTLFASGRLPQTYLRYVERSLRERFDFGATPIKIRVRVG
jgi:GTP-binding protein